MNDSSKSWRCGGVLPGQKHRVSIADQADVRHIRVVWVGDDELNVWKEQMIPKALLMVFLELRVAQ